MSAPPPLRTILFVPGNDRRKIGKALGLGATAVMLDLEEPLAAAKKAAARAIVCESALTAGAALIGVRINSPASGLAEADLDALAPALSRIALITVPLVEGPDENRHVAGRLDELERISGLPEGGVALLAMAETARGVLAAREIAESSPRLPPFIFGPADLGRELGGEPTAEGIEFPHARSAIVLAA